MFRIISIVCLAGVVVGTAGHYLIFGAKHPEVAREKKEVRRFSIWERLVHALTLLSFLTLAITGFVGVIGYDEPLGGYLMLLHYVAAPGFALGLALLMLTWVHNCFMEGYDWEWLRHVGGYLGGGKDYPSGRFNAGQKIYFWLAVLAALLVVASGLGRFFPVFGAEGQDWLLWIHRYSALFLAAAAIGHVYLGTLANPGTWTVILFGCVSEAWARHHHPLWRKPQERQESQK